MKKKVVVLFGVLALCAGMFACSGKNSSVLDMNLEKKVTLGQYKGIEVNTISTSVSDTEVDAQVFQYLLSCGDTFAVYEGTAQNGQTVNINYSGSIDGEKFDGGTAEGQDLTLGSNTFIPGFEAQVVGMEVGDDRDINVTFPEDYGKAELAGKDAVFAIHLNYIYPDKMTEEMFAKLEDPDFDSLADFRSYVREYLSSKREDTLKNKVRGEIMDSIMASTTVTGIPKDLRESQNKIIYTNYAQPASAQNMSVEDYVRLNFNMTVDELIDNFASRRMIIARIAQVENLVPDEEEVNQYMRDVAKSYNLEPEAFCEQNNVGYEDFRESLTSDKVYDFLYDNAVKIEGKNEK